MNVYLQLQTKFNEVVNTIRHFYGDGDDWGGQISTFQQQQEQEPNPLEAGGVSGGGGQSLDFFASRATKLLPSLSSSQDELGIQYFEQMRKLQQQQHTSNMQQQPQGIMQQPQQGRRQRQQQQQQQEGQMLYLECMLG